MIKKYNNDLDAITPELALEILMDGNQRFQNGLTAHKDFLSKVELTGKVQKPFAVLLSCMDSRAPVEHLFDQGIGDVFSVRMAGNIISENVLGSLEYAVAVVGSKLIMVMGHSNCGAIKGAIDDVNMGNLTQLLHKIKPAVESAKEKVDNHCSSNKAYVDAVAELNVANSVQSILNQSPIIRELVMTKKIMLVGAMYCVEKVRYAFWNPSISRARGNSTKRSEYIGLYLSGNTALSNNACIPSFFLQCQNCKVLRRFSSCLSIYPRLRIRLFI